MKATHTRSVDVRNTNSKTLKEERNMKKTIICMIAVISMAIMSLASAVGAQYYMVETPRYFTENLAPVPGTSCGTYDVYDCAGNCVDFGTALDWINDGYCDDGSYGMDLMCDEFFNDGADCGAYYVPGVSPSQSIPEEDEEEEEAQPSN
jgi:hypothetical protein